MTDDIEKPALASQVRPAEFLSKYQDIDVSQASSVLLLTNSSSSHPIERPKLLILSDIFDFESDRLGHYLSSMNFPYARINTSYIPSRLQLSISYQDGKHHKSLVTGHSTVSLQDVSCILYRHFQTPKHQFSGDALSSSIYSQEWNAAISYILGDIPAINFSPGTTGDHLVFRQFDIAAAAGLRTPPTIISSNPSHLTSFLDFHGGPFIMKSIGLHHVIHNDRFYTFYADNADVSHIMQLVEKDLSAPILLQMKVEISFDLRVTFVEGCMLFTRIDRPKSCRNVDYKSNGDLSELDIKEYFPSEVFRGACESFIQKSGLLYGAIDFVVTSTGVEYFLEVNACPDWHWLQAAHSTSITALLAQALITRSA